MERDDTVLVVASDAALRRSLTFLLESEGYGVSEHETLEHANDSGTTRRRCAVVDDALLAGADDAWPRIAGLADTIILLQSHAREHPRGVVIVEKPLLGQFLVAAVKSAMTQGSSST